MSAATWSGTLASRGSTSGISRLSWLLVWNVTLARLSPWRPLLLALNTMTLALSQSRVFLVERSIKPPSNFWMRWSSLMRNRSCDANSVSVSNCTASPNATVRAFSVSRLRRKPAAVRALKSSVCCQLASSKLRWALAAAFFTNSRASPILSIPFSSTSTPNTGASSPPRMIGDTS